MSFSGRVSRESHEGGLLVSFEGRAPRLGAGIRVVGGKTLGRVETVLGPSDEPLVHVHPLNGGVEGVSAIGSPVEIAPSGRANQSRHNSRTSESRFRRGRDSRPGSRQGNDQRGRDRKFGRDRNSNMKPGDWSCPKCKNHNYAKRTVCNRCDTRKPVEGKGSRKTQGRRRRPNPRDNWKGGGRPSSRHKGRGR